MKFCPWIAVTIAIPATACGPQPAPVVVAPANPTVVTPVTPVVVRDVDPVTREVYVAGMRDKLKDFDVQLATWNDKLTKSEGQPRVAMQSKMAELKLKRDQFDREIIKLAESAGLRWVHEKSAADRAFVELKATFDRAADAFR